MGRLSLPCLRCGKDPVKEHFDGPFRTGDTNVDQVKTQLIGAGILCAVAELRRQVLPGSGHPAAAIEATALLCAVAVRFSCAL